MKAAQQLGRKRWERMTDEEKVAHMENMRQKRQAKLTPEQRSESARKAAAARWAKKRGGAKKKTRTETN